MATKPRILIASTMKNNLIILLLACTALMSCKKVRPTLGDPPSQMDAAFTAVPSDSNANIIQLTASNPNLVCRWDFGNGVKGEGVDVTATYPYAGTYTITLTVFKCSTVRLLMGVIL